MVKTKKGVDELNGSSFEDKIGSGISVIDFFAEWCMPCLMMSPIVEEVSDKFKGKVNFGKVNVDKNPQLASRFGVMSIPTFIFFKDAEEIERHTGSMSAEQFETKIKNLM